jgi:hypothetical protein
MDFGWLYNIKGIKEVWLVLSEQKVKGPKFEVGGI